MSKTDRIAELEAKVTVLESTIERLDADRKTFVRHQETLCRNIRKLMAENREFRADVNGRALASINDLITAPLRMVPVLEERA